MAPQKTNKTQKKKQKQNSSSKVARAKGLPPRFSGFDGSPAAVQPLAAVFSNPTTSTKELYMTALDYFRLPLVKTDPNSAEPTLDRNITSQYLLRLSDLFVDASTGTSDPAAVIKKVDFYCLPAGFRDFDMFTVLFGLPCQQAVSTSSTNATVATQTTTITPTSVLDWVHVGGWNSDTIDSTNVQLLSTGAGYVCLGAIAAVDPNDYTAAVNVEPAFIQYCVKVTFTQYLPNLITSGIEITVGYGDTENGPPPPGPFSSITPDVLETSDKLQIEAVSVRRIDP